MRSYLLERQDAVAQERDIQGIVAALEDTGLDLADSHKTATKIFKSALRESKLRASKLGDDQKTPTPQKLSVGTRLSECMVRLLGKCEMPEGRQEEAAERASD